MPLGTSLAGVRLGMTTDEVFRALGTPSRRGDESTAWIYDRGIIVYFSSSEAREPAPRVERVVAWAGSSARTEEGFSLDGCRQSGKVFDPSVPGCGPGRLRYARDFRETYAAFEIEEWTNGIATRFEPFRILSVRGVAPDGAEVVLRASFGPVAERVDLSLSRSGLGPSGDLLPRQNYRIDPFVISACELLARAEVRAGYGEGYGIMNGYHGVGPNGRVCSVRDDGNGDPHLFWYPRPVRPQEFDSLLYDVATAIDPAIRSFRAIGTGQSAHSQRWRSDDGSGGPKVAIYLEPYLFVVWADAGHVERLAEAIRAELTRP